LDAIDDEAGNDRRQRNNRKKLEPSKPNWRALSCSSVISGTAAIPITALSAKLINMKKKSKATISQAACDARLWVPVRAPPGR
jgi:hypothetical protein